MVCNLSCSSDAISILKLDSSMHAGDVPSGRESYLVIINVMIVYRCLSRMQIA
jgi:hypothetical protein